MTLPSQRYPRDPWMNRLAGGNNSDMNWHGRQVPATHNVIAVFDDLAHARHAIEVLERAGIDAGDIALLGPSAEIAEDMTEERRAPGSWWRLASGVGVGALTGLVAGLLVGWISAVFFTDGRLTASLITGAVAGMIGGSLFGAMASLALGDAWELAHEHVPGRVAVNVGSDDERTIQRAHTRLEHQDPIRLMDFDDTDITKRDDTTWIIDLLEETQPAAPGPLTN